MSVSGGADIKSIATQGLASGSMALETAYRSGSNMVKALISTTAQLAEGSKGEMMSQYRPKAPKPIRLNPSTNNMLESHMKARQDLKDDYESSKDRTTFHGDKR